MKYVGLNLIATVAFISGGRPALRRHRRAQHGRPARPPRRPRRRDPDPRLGRLPDLRLRLQGGALPAVLLAAGLLPHPLLRHLGALLRAPHQGRGLRADPRLHPGLRRRRHADPDPAPLAAPSPPWSVGRPRGAGDDRGAPRPRLLDHRLDRLHDPRPRRGDAARARRRGLLPLPGRAGEGEPLPRRRRGPPADRLRGTSAARAASGAQRPWFALLFLVPALSLAGVPPFSGFWAKLLLAKATLDAGRWGLTFAVLAVGLLTLFAMARIWSEVFWDAHPDGADAITGALPPAMLAPLVVLAASSSSSASTPDPSSTSRSRWRRRSIDPRGLRRRRAGGAAMILWPWHVLVLVARLRPRPRGLEPAGGEAPCSRPATSPAALRDRAARHGALRPRDHPGRELHHPDPRHADRGRQPRPLARSSSTACSPARPATTCAPTSGTASSRG